MNQRTSAKISESRPIYTTTDCSDNSRGRKVAIPGKQDRVCRTTASRTLDVSSVKVFFFFNENQYSYFTVKNIIQSRLAHENEKYIKSKKLSRCGQQALHEEESLSFCNYPIPFPV